MFDINSTVDQLLSSLDKLSFDVESAKFSPKINFNFTPIKEKATNNTVQGPKGHEMIFTNDMWLPLNFHQALTPAPKHFNISEEDVKESDLVEIEKRLNNIKGNLDIKKYLPKIKELSKEYLDTSNSGALNSLIKLWNTISEDTKESLSSREKALSGIEKLVGPNIADKVKKTVLSIPDPKEAYSHIKDNFRNIKQDVKKEDDKPKGYTPEMDKDKKEFTVKDVEYILGIIKEKHKSGLDGVINPLKKLFNGDLINSLVMAYRKYEGMEGLVDFLKHYDTKKDQLSKTQPHMKLPSNISEVLAPTEDILDSLKEIKDDYPSEYKDSFLEYTEDLLKLMLKYIRNGEKIPRFEELFTEIFLSGMRMSQPGVISQWGSLKYPSIYEKIKKIKNPITTFFKQSEPKKENEHKEHLKLVDKGDKKMVVLPEDEKNQYVKDIAKLINNAVHVSEDDEDLIKEIKEDDKGVVKEITEKDLSDTEKKDKRKKYREFRKKLKDKEEEEKYNLLSPKEQVDYRLKKKQEELAKEERKKQKSKNKDDTKKSSSSGLPIFTRIESLRDKSVNPIVKAELEDILNVLKIEL